MTATKPLLLTMAIAVIGSVLVGLITGSAPLSAFSDLGQPGNVIDFTVFLWDIITGIIAFFVAAVTWNFLADAGVDSTFVTLLQTLSGGLLAWAIVERFW